MPDIQPYKSMVTGEEITSRSRHRAHLKEHNRIEIGNEWMPDRPEYQPNRAELVQALLKQVR
jgi:hypothetical protein